ncbi:glycosyltransferase [Isosphaeraceae bacterium EP7]
MSLETDAAIGGGDDSLLVILPVFNDWPALGKLLVGLDAALGGANLAASILVVDDGSTSPAPAGWPGGPFAAIDRVSVLTLRRNLGHQRAIAVGLSFVEGRVPCRAVVLMDADGEDDPRDVPRLLEQLDRDGGHTVVFAGRSKRSESLAFRFFYGLFRGLHRVLIGHGVRVGNFSAISRERLSSLVVVSELWNHYAASVLKSRQPHSVVPTVRARRLDGESKMNFVGLVIHGLSALSVQSEVVGVRVLVAAFGLVGLSLLGLAAIILIRLATDLAIPGWATTSFGVLLLLLTQTVMFAFLFSFLIIGGRQASSFLPSRDYHHFVGPVRTAYQRS